MFHKVSFYIGSSFFLLNFLILNFLRLIRNKKPLLYCSFHPFSRIMYLFFWSFYFYSKSYEVFNTNSTRFTLIIVLVSYGLLVCLLILKYKQILRAPRFEFRKLKESELNSLQDHIDEFMKEKSAEIKKERDHEIGFKENYYFYEINKDPFLYIEVKSAELLSEVSMEFYPFKSFDLRSVHQLMKKLYKSFSKNVIAPYLEGNRTLHYKIAGIFALMAVIVGFIYIEFNYENSYLSLFFAIPILFIFFDTFRKIDKKNFLDNQL